MTASRMQIVTVAAVPVAVAAAAAGYVAARHQAPTTSVKGEKYVAQAAGGNQNNNNGFTMSGSIGSLWPGKSTSVSVYVQNTNQSTIYLTSLSVAAGTATSNASRATVTGCPGTLLTFSNLTNVHIAVPAGSKSSPGTPISVPLKLGSSTPNACANVTWPLTFSGTAASS